MGGAFALARISHTLAAHLANHLAASGFVLPRHITLDMPWSSSPLTTKALRNLNHPSVAQQTGIGDAGHGILSGWSRGVSSQTFTGLCSASDLKPASRIF
jgi:hypothetical protein